VQRGDVDVALAINFRQVADADNVFGHKLTRN
jgi:hypothetical protein